MAVRQPRHGSGGLDVGNGGGSTDVDLAHTVLRSRLREKCHERQSRYTGEPISSATRMSHSEPILNTELYDSRAPGLGLNSAESARSKVHHRIAPIEVVQQIESLDPEFEIMAARDRQQA